MEALKQAVQQSVKPTQRRSKHAIACAVVLGVVVAAGAQQMVRAVLNTDGLELATEPRKFFDGTLTQALEKQLDQKMPARASLIAFANGLRPRPEAEAHVNRQGIKQRQRDQTWER